MKKILYGALICFILAIVSIAVGANINGAPSLAYVYSNSMEPLIGVNDAFIIVPTSQLKPGDIIMYRPSVLKAPYITHRIKAVGDHGFITKGDNSPYEDQESGEPEIGYDKIVGKVLAVNGQPLVFSGLGSFSASIQQSWGNYTRYMSLLFLALAAISVVFGKSKKRRRKPRRRLRLRDVYKGIVLGAMVLVMLSIFIGSQVTQFQYLVTEYPGTLGNQVEVNKPGQLKLKVKSSSLIPVWSIASGIAPLSVHKAPKLILPRGSETVVLDVLPERKLGFYQGYVRISNYPVLLPRKWLELLHTIDPLLAAAATALATGALLALLLWGLSHIHGFEGWMPLKAIKDKISQRRLNRIKANMIGKRRVRT